MLKIPKEFGAIWLFGLSVLIGKGLSLVSVPIVARHLPPSEYGRLELISSFVEVSGIVMSFGLADSLFRFASMTRDAARRRVAAGLAGSAILMAALAGVALQVLAWTLPSAFGAPELSLPLSLGLLTASLAGLVELPLAWLRLNAQPGRYLAFTAARSMAQTVAVTVALTLGYGVIGMLACNAAIEACVAATLVGSQARRTGVTLDRETLRRAVTYGLPLVGGSISMFALGSCDRWFLAATVAPDQLGLYGLAVKLSLLVPLSIQPFGLWWYARRINTLSLPDGREVSARMTAVGMTLLGAGVAVACGGAPIVVDALFPPVYRGALVFLPWLAVAAGLNELCSLVNVGVYAARTSFGVFAVNGLGGAVALVGYVWLTPSHGVAGAIAATIAGQMARLALFLVIGQRVARIPYRWGCFAMIVTIDAALAGVSARAATPLEHGLPLAAALLALALVASRLALEQGARPAREALA